MFPEIKNSENISKKTPKRDDLLLKFSSEFGLREISGKILK